MTATPIWFGPEQRPLLGFFHLPPGARARGGVVVCPPFGRDYLHAHYALRLLAEGLADRGLCVLRFDYDGTGDSAGDHRDPDRVEAWLGSVDAAVRLVRDAGAPSVTAVGMRIGATLAGVAAGRGAALDGLVLWDPVASGRAYLAEQRASSALTFGPSTARDDGSVEVPGHVFDAQVARDMRSMLDLNKTEGPLAARVLVLARPDRDPGRLARRLEGPDVEWSHTVGQAELMDVGSPNQLLPYRDIERVADWVASGPDGPAVPIEAPTPAGGAVVARGPGVVETPVSVGPAGLFGVVSDVPGATGGPAVIFLSVGNEHRIGPSRLWVDLSRQWAAAGLRCLRVDLSGLGDSPTRHPDQPRFVPRPPEAFDDVIDAARAMRPDEPSDVVLVGLCAAGYQVLDSSFEITPRGVVAVNPVISFRPPELAAGRPLERRRRVALPRNSVVQSFSGNGSLSGLRRRFPDLGWRLRLLAAPRRRSARWLRALTGRGIDILIVCGQREARPIHVGASARTLARLRRSGRLRFELIADLEHGLLIAEQRHAVTALVSEHVLGRFAPTTGRAGSLRRGEVVSAPVAPDSLSQVPDQPLAQCGGAAQDDAELQTERM